MPPKAHKPTPGPCAKPPPQSNTQTLALNALLRTPPPPRHTLSHTPSVFPGIHSWHRGLKQGNGTTAGHEGPGAKEQRTRRMRLPSGAALRGGQGGRPCTLSAAHRLPGCVTTVRSLATAMQTTGECPYWGCIH